MSTSQAKWRDLSGLTVEAEKSLQGSERRAALRKLFTAAESRIRIELQAAAEDTDFKSERTFLWDPTPAVCRKLEISQSALTRHLKELTGMSTMQLADKIRAEGLREKLRAELTAFVQTRNTKPGDTAGTTSSPLKIFRDKLKASRAHPSFSLATRAIEMGFANYTRFYRACLLQYGKTPTQLEDEILKEIAEYFDCAEALIHRREATQRNRLHDTRYDPHRKPYSDSWSKALETRPDWLTQNQALFGVTEEAQAWL